ncbi:hypothetical protein L202_04664 [Cryptococcus amylolentus CBS 6039]|uniref:beta-glucosidase n=1 Tax=Cryptococcus amylolentus CBS 6039 TaxID=1295533 RepID=A0A1E3HMC1_9TREE|nr:hypothetical protein L202_04664 [Cryptococcus amylolentus CBS 6039]ODN77490.1 hypothetical protein L202_04664 [Cryptococcus amylolentus CBS 6039]
MLASPLTLLLLGAGVPAAIASPFRLINLRDDANSTDPVTDAPTASWTQNSTTSASATEGWNSTESWSSTASASPVSVTSSVIEASTVSSTIADPTSLTSWAESSVSATASESATADETWPSEAPADDGTISSYHTSDITYISPNIPAPLNATHANSSPKWEAAHSRARERLAGWSLEEKVHLTTGVGWMQGKCVGNIPAVESQGFGGLCLQDSPLGVRFADYVSAFPAGINAAATFDKDLIYARGYAMGQEFKGKGVNVALGPMTNMGRVAAGGRNWEGFGADPYLSGWATDATVRGIQDAGVQACVKHYVGNEQERNRTTSSSNIDDRTLREIYTHPFLRAVQADVAAVMCSYNLVNGSWACQDSKTLNGVLKTDFGFQGYVTADWGAQHSGVLSANTGLDMTMPGDISFGSLTSYWGQNLTDSVNNGSVKAERVDDMAERILAAYYLLGQDEDYPEVNFDSFRLFGSNQSHVDVRDDHYKVIRHVGASSTVLLKNENKALPLTTPRHIALIGSDLGPAIKGPNGISDRGGIDGTTAMGWGSGTAEFPYLVDPLSAISQRAREHGAILNSWLDDWDVASAQYWAAPAEVAIVGVHATSGEEYITVDGNVGDRNNLTLWTNGDALVQGVAAVNNNTIVVVHAPGPILMEEWISNPNVTAVLWAGLPGQESGNALVDILWGDYNPSGRLPYTIAKDRADYPADIVYTNTDDPIEPQVDYTEGLNIDYRHFLAEGIEPRFAFGYGLSYTSFDFKDLKVEAVEGEKRKRDDVPEFPEVDESPQGEVVVGRFTVDSLHKPRWTVSIDVTNTGDINGCEVPQLYLVFPEHAGEPPKVLRDFARINLDPGATKTVSWNLSQYDVSIWDVETQEWTVPEGDFGVEVGKYVADVDAQTSSFCFKA